MKYEFGRGDIAVRVHVSCAEGLRFESDSMTSLNAHSLFTQWQHWEIKAARKGTGHPTSYAVDSG